MTLNERKIERIVRAVVVSAIAVFCALICTLSVTVAIRLNQNKQEKALLAAQEKLKAQLAAEIADQSYYESEAFLEEYALTIHGFGRDGAKIFKSA
jgi:cell division protein FtsB